MRKIAKKVKHRISNLDRSNFKRPQFLVFVLGFALIGTYLLFQSLAAVNFLKVEAEVVAPVGNATRVPAANASGSGNNVVQFGAASSAPIRYEAENAAHDPNSVVENKPSGGVLGSFGHQGQFVTFTVSVQNTGDYAAVLRYAAADGTATKLDPLPRTLLINNVQIRNIDFPRTSSASDQWDTLTTKSIDTLHLTGGTPNTVTFRIDTTQEGYWDVDYLEVAGATGTTPPPPPTCPPGTHGTPPDNCVPDTTPPPPPTGTYTPPNGLPGISIPTNAKFVATNGNDSNPGTDALPWRSISQSVGKLVAGDTLVIKAGDYTLTESTQDPHDPDSKALMGVYDKNGNANAWIKIVGDPRGVRPRLYGPWDGSAWQILYVRSSSYIWAQYLELYSNSGSVQGKVSGGFARASHHVRFYDLWSHDGGGCGICADASNHIEIRGNYVWNTSNWNEYNTSGFSFIAINSGLGGGNNADGYSNYIVGNLGWNNEALVAFIGGYGITDGNCVIMDVTNQSTRTLIANNICADNGGRGFHAVNFNNADFFNNTSYHNVRSNTWSVADGSELSSQNSSGMNFMNNVVWPRPEKSSRFMYNDSGANFSGNAWVGGNPGGGIQVGTDVIANPQNDPRLGNWTIGGAAAGKGAPWPLKTTYPN